MADKLSPEFQTEGALRNQIVQTSESEIVAPKNIISNVSAGRAVYFNYRQEHLKRIQLYAQIEGLIAGNPPYNPTELAKKKLSHIANFNNLEARAYYERGGLSYWNLLNETEWLVEFEVDPGNPAPELVGIQQIMAEEWTKVLRSWPAFNTLMATLSAQIVKFGISPVIFPDERDFAFKVVELQRFFIPDQCSTNPELWTSICVETDFTVQELYQHWYYFKHEAPKEQREDCPWNLDALARYLVWRANSWVKDNTLQCRDMMDLQRRLQNGDINYGEVFSDTVRLVSLLYKEYDGKISHYMFDSYWGDCEEFLFVVSEQYEKWQDVLTVFTASPGEFTIHSNRGVGHKIFSSCQATMQLDCSSIDAARWAGTIFLRSIATGSKDAEAVRFWPGIPTNIGTAEFVQNNIGANIQNITGVSQYIKSSLNSNLTNGGDNPGVPDANQGSIAPSQARAKDYKEFNVLRNAISHFYESVNLVYRNITKAMYFCKDGYPNYQYAKLWKDNCIKRGVPEEILKRSKKDMWGMPEGITVKASQVAGDGSTLARIMGLQDLGPLVPDFGPREAREYKKQYIAATMGPQFVRAFTQDSGNADERAGGASLAYLENNSMSNGQSALMSPDNEQRAHFVTHLALGNDIINRIQQQQMDAVGADKVFSVLIPHMTEHYNVLKASPFAQGFLSQVESSWRQLSDYAKLNRKNAASQMQAQIRKQQEQQEKQQQVLSDQELKTLQVTADEKRKDLQMQSKERRTDEANQTRGEVMKQKVITDSSNQRLKIQLEAGNKKIKNQNDSLANKPLPELRQDLADLNGATVAPADIEV